MTLHIVLGDGYMPTKELTAHLQDMRARALVDDDAFWFMLQAKPEPTDTDRAIIKWLTAEEHDIYWDAIGDADAADKIYEGAQNIHKASKIASTVVKLMEQAKAGGVDEEGEVVEPEGADLLALYFSDEEDAEEDRWLNDVISAVADAEFPVFALNDGMTPIEPDGDMEPVEDDEDGEGEFEELVEEAKAARQAATATVTFHTRDELLEMDLDELKKIAVERGVEVAPRSRKPTYVDAILGEEETVPEVELEAPPGNVHVGSSITATLGANTNTTSNVAYMVPPETMSGPAMVIVVYNGTVTSKVVTAAQAQALLSS